MTERQDEAKVVPIGAPATADRLPYTIELWDLTRAAPERVIGRAASAVLARAIFTAALSEHLGRRIVLRRGAQILAESD
jgi:MoxR-like ATPase